MRWPVISGGDETMALSGHTHKGGSHKGQQEEPSPASHKEGTHTVSVEDTQCTAVTNHTQCTLVTNHTQCISVTNHTPGYHLLLPNTYSYEPHQCTSVANHIECVQLGY